MSSESGTWQVDMRVAAMQQGGGNAGTPRGKRSEGGGPPASRAARIQSVDVARGFTMVMMIMIDNQGSFWASDIWWPFSETDWAGFGTADCIFPGFLFIAGLSATIALARESFDAWRTRVASGKPAPAVEFDGYGWFPSCLARRAGGARGCCRLPARVDVALRIVSRAVRLFAIGALLNLWAGGFHVSTWKYLGVLQRIAMCYGALSLLYVYTPLFVLRAFALACVAAYCGILYAVPVPRCPRGSFDVACNAASYVDRVVLGAGHVTADGTLPEGLTSTLTAFVTTYLGFEFGLIMRRLKERPGWLAGVWLAVACAFAALGGGLSVVQPVIKKIWTVSFLFAAAATAGATLAVCVALVDVKYGCCKRTCGSRTYHRMRPESEAELLAKTSVNFADDPAPLVEDAHVVAQPLLVDGAATPGSGSGSGSGRGTWLVPEARWVSPLIWLGRNAAIVFVAMVALEILLMDTLKLDCSAADAAAPNSVCMNGQQSVWAYVYTHGFAARVSNSRFASSLVGLCHLGLWTLVTAVLYRLRIFITL